MLIDDIEYVIFRHPDLSAARDFMTDYGLLDAGRQGNSLYLRSCGDAPVSYVTTEGETAFIGMGFRVACYNNLLELSTRFGAPIEDCPHPGGGKYFHAIDPEGRRLEFVFGARRSIPVPAGGAKRLGHLAVFSPAPRQMIEWYCRNLGMRPSELIHDGDEANVMASFLHLDKGPAWTDHHTLAIVQGPAPGLDHVSFECRDLDDLSTGTMRDKGHRHRWSIGRHFHGGHAFDYWTDPAGFHFEHYSDGDLVNQDTPILRYRIGRDTLLQWAPPFPGI